MDDDFLTVTINYDSSNDAKDDVFNELEKVEREYAQKSATNNPTNNNQNTIGFQFNNTSKFIVSPNATPNVPPKTKKTFLTSTNWISPTKTSPAPAPPSNVSLYPKPQTVAQKFNYPAPAAPPAAPTRNYTPTKPPAPKSFKSPAFGENGSTTFSWNKTKTQRKSPAKRNAKFSSNLQFSARQTKKQKEEGSEEEEEGMEFSEKSEIVSYNDTMFPATLNFPEDDQPPEFDPDTIDTFIYPSIIKIKHFFSLDSKLSKERLSVCYGTKEFKVQYIGLFAYWLGKDFYCSCSHV
jgi:hypothetical protein